MVGRLAVVSIFCCAPAAALGQRTTENVILSAEDAYGTSVGRDSIGLYRSSWVRGFSPTVAGNARIDGLYFDQVWNPSQRISNGTRVRVGLSVFGSPFPAPTGVVDYQLRRPGEGFAANLFGAYDSFGGYLLEGDFVVPVQGERLNLGVGVAGYRKAFHNGTNAVQLQGSLIARWRPRKETEIIGFLSLSNELADEVGPVYVPGGRFLPPTARRRLHIGPAWAVHRGTAANYGAIATTETSESSRLRFGLFRSVLDNTINFSNVLADLQPSGSARHIVTVDPEAKTASTSGEARWTLLDAREEIGQAVHLSVRARARRREYGGSAVFDLGPITLNERQTAAGPVFQFRPLTRDRVDQITGGLAYELRWPRRLEVDASVQYSRYRKATTRPNADPIRARSEEILGSVAVAGYVSPRLVLYGGYARGLEEGGIAPVTAANRNEAAPAILTSQVDAGMRWEIRPDLKAIAAVFEVEKPYYNVDATNVWRRRGSVRNRGVEFSLAGKIRPNLRLVAGAALMDPKVTAERSTAARVGKRPVDVAQTTFLASAEWQMPGEDRLSLNLGASYIGAVAATADNQVRLPERLIVDTGARYRFQIGNLPASARLQVTNLGGVYGFTSRGSGVYGLLPSRQATLSIAVDR